MKDEKRIASSQRESDTQLLKFLVDDLSFTIQLLGTLKTQAMALQFNILTILPLLWTLQMSFFAMGSRKKLSWDGTGKKMFSFKMCLTVSNVCASQQLCALLGLRHSFWDGVAGKAVSEQWFYAMLQWCFQFWFSFSSSYSSLFAFLTTEHWADISGNYPELFWDLFHELLM